MEYEVDYFLVKLSPALTFVLTFIPVLLFLDIDVERRRRVLGFEAGDHRRSHVQARTSWQIDHSRKNPAEGHRRADYRKKTSRG
ncbi:MAG TPA: hypothetical protein VI260_29025 [Blastocatellia bacterium]|jgi:hypothetical protein